MTQTHVGPANSIAKKSVTSAGGWAVGRGVDGDAFAVSRRCRHLYADLAEGTVAADGCLVCPWHGAKYDVDSGRMTRGPQGIFAKIPGLSASFRMLTKVLPLRRGTVVERDGELYVD